MASYVTVHSPLGVPLADFNADVFRANKISDWAEAHFELSTNDNKCKEEYLRFGNMLLVQHDSLPPWVGFIDFPREWNDDKVKVNAISAEVYMDWRMCLPFQINTDSAGLVREIIRQCNLWPGLKIIEGSVDRTGGGTRDWILGGKANDMINQTNAEWDITPNTDTGILRLELNAHRWMGKQTRFVLDEFNSKNFSPKFAELGPIFNHMFVVASVDSAGARSYVEFKDDYSIARYGLRQVILETDGLTLADLQVTASGKLSVFKDVQYTATPTVLNVGSAFSYLGLGNSIGWTNSTAGFYSGGIGTDVSMRILAREYDDVTDQAALVVKTGLPNLPQGMFGSDAENERGFFLG